jgi:RimJ/RimL family protein N-acetyltransferase
MELFTPRLILREFRENDLSLFRELEAHPETYRFESAHPDDAQIRGYLEKAQSDGLQTPRPRYRLALTICPADEVRGRVTLALMNDSIREWEIGWAIHLAEWGKGFAVETAQRLLEFAFTDLGAHRVVAFSHAENAASLRVMQKLGMQQDGLLRETRPWRGAWSDEVVYSILEREWLVFQAGGQL